MKWIVYLTTNTVNKKTYCGVHQTEDPDVFDGYIGCGVYVNQPSSYNHPKTLFQQAVHKYGPSKFIRHILKVYDNENDAYNLESTIVDNRWVNSAKTYNMIKGGKILYDTSKQVYQFDMHGSLINIWKNSVEINKFFNSSASITDIINNKRTFMGYIWSFDQDININEYQFSCKRGSISQYNLNGELIEVFLHTQQAAQKLDISRESITLAVYKQKPYMNCYFLKSDVDISVILRNKFHHSLNRRPIYRYCLDGKFDKEFSTTSEAIKNTPNTYPSSLKNAVVNGYKCGNYLWSYKRCENYFNLENPKEYLKPRKIGQYDLNGNLIKIWNSYKECKEVYKYCNRVCNGNLKSTQGYIFKYMIN